MNNLNLPIFNRDSKGEFKLPEDGWFHLVPKGEFKHSSGDVQVIDDKAVQDMCNRFAQDSQAPNYPGTLVDFDHFSYDPSKPSSAAGWITDMQPRENGVWGKIRWSDEGNAALTNGRYRLISPTWKANDVEEIGAHRVRPLRLDSAGLTNQPNMRGMVPLSNREDNFNETENKQMKSVSKLLGLPETASESDVLGSVQALMNRATTADDRANKLVADNAKLLGVQVEADLTKYSNRIKPESREQWKGMLLSNREPTIALLESISIPVTVPDPATPKPMHNRENSGTPDPVASGAKPDTFKTVREYQNRMHCDFQTAWDATRQEKPELFSK